MSAIVWKRGSAANRRTSEILSMESHTAASQQHHRAHDLGGGPCSHNDIVKLETREAPPCHSLIVRWHDLIGRGQAVSAHGVAAGGVEAVAGLRAAGPIRPLLVEPGNNRSDIIIIVIVIIIIIIIIMSRLSTHGTRQPGEQAQAPLTGSQNAALLQPHV
ncbi:hypothetical protein EYF80_051955 [Liparis tanakae]|uniref:Uncharacterized protein n=1 Tax=Liparis tanakae TaxID=230148 RepID=A0A4Z2FBU9_9TELE|nr:hypothetical protein EYF80_051955 [Liparis tanakae]